MPSPFAGRQMLAVLRGTGGGALAVSERAIAEAQALLARLEGIWTSPEGAALVAALGALKDAGLLDPGARIVLVLTGCGFKYPAPDVPPVVDLTGSPAEMRATVRGACEEPAETPAR